MPLIKEHKLVLTRVVRHRKGALQIVPWQWK